MVVVISCAAAAFQLCTVREHKTGIGYTFCFPFVADINGGQFIAAAEHRVHIRYAACIKAAQIKCCQFTAPMEHRIHIRYAACIKAAQIK